MSVINTSELRRISRSPGQLATRRSSSNALSPDESAPGPLRLPVPVKILLDVTVAVLQACRNTWTISTAITVIIAVAITTATALLYAAGNDWCVAREDVVYRSINTKDHERCHRGKCCDLHDAGRTLPVSCDQSGGMRSIRTRLTSSNGRYGLICENARA
jgi:hypothetical protein